MHTKPDIALPVGMVEIFYANPKENHMMEIKRIMIYLKGTKDYGFWYKKRANFEFKTFIG